MKLSFVFSLFFCVMTLSSNQSPLATVPYVDPVRYMGTWYEIARLPNSFEVNCIHSTADYTLKSDGTIEVVNTCCKANGCERGAHGVATISNAPHNSQLKVNFVPKWLRWTGLGWGNYWIIDLGTNYEYSVVSEPNRDYLWILSRTPNMDNAQYQIILNNLRNLHFDLSRLIKTGEVASKSRS